MTRLVNRRRFLALALPICVTPGGVLAAAGATPARLEREYRAYVGVLFDLLRFSVSGRVTGELDTAAGRYRATVSGVGSGVEGRTVSSGVIRDHRFVPLETTTVGTVRGRPHHGQVTYDLEGRVVRLRSVSHTLLLGRRREVDDMVVMPPGVHVDDLLSAQLNFAANALDREPDGGYRVTVVRRARAEDEGADDVAADGYRAELKTLRFRPNPQPATGGLLALVDLTGFSSWARAGQPAEVTFGRDRHLESIRSSLILGTTFTLRVGPAS